jgi:ATP-dependent protease ClpP protease subunit
MLFLLFVIILNVFILGTKIDKIILDDNIISINKEITDEVASNFIYELNKHVSKENIYLYLDTNGGSVIAGNRIIDEVQKYNLDCIAKTAVSMGFTILQACNNRFITKYSILMQHQMHYSVSNEKEKLENFVEFITQISKSLDMLQANKIGIEPKILKEKTLNEWWLFGENALTENCADKLVDIQCSSALTNKTYTEDLLGYTYTYSKCPLVTTYIHKKKSKDGNKYEDFVFLM